MSKIFIKDIDLKVANNQIDTNKALVTICKYISKEIDPFFPIADFMKWCDSDSDKPFKCNGNTYHWNQR